MRGHLGGVAAILGAAILDDCGHAKYIAALSVVGERFAAMACAKRTV